MPLAPSYNRAYYMNPTRAFHLVQGLSRTERVVKEQYYRPNGSFGGEIGFVSPRPGRERKYRANDAKPEKRNAGST